MKKITEMYAFVFTDDEGNEGIPMLHVRALRTSYIMVDGDIEQIKKFLPRVEELSKDTGKPFRIYRYGNREDVTDLLKKEGA